MILKFKKFFCFLFFCCLIIWIIGYSCIQTDSAEKRKAGWIAGTEKVYQKASFRKYEKRLKKRLRIRNNEESDAFGFDDDGNFIMVTRDQIATSQTTYRTIGWTIKRYDAPIQYNESIRIALLSTGESKIDPDDPEYAYHYYICTRDTIFSKIEQCSKDWLQELYVNGGYVYFDAVMTVAEYDVPLGGMYSDGTVYGAVYFTYEGIAGARGWLDPESLRTHFDKKVYFPENHEMLYGSYEVHYMELNGDTEIPLTYLGLDIGKRELRDGLMEFEPGETGENDLKYIKTKIVYKKYQESEKATSTDRKYTADNRNLDFKYVKVYFFFERQEHTQEIIITYGDAFIERNHLEISAEDKDNPKFDVKKGIPVTEQLRIDGRIQKYMYEITCEKHSGIKMVPVEVTVIYSVLIPSEYGEKLQNVSEKRICYVPRNYSYIKIKDYKIYYADEIDVENYSFPEEKIEIRSFYDPEIFIKTQKEEYVFVPEASVSIYGGLIGGEVSSILGSDEIQQAAERACGKVKVGNDTICIDGETVLEEGPFEINGEELLEFDGGRTCIVQEEQIHILPVKRNGIWKSKAKISYRLYGENERRSFAIGSVNEVVIHTPVVCNGGASDEISFNQQIEPTKNHSFILGRDFRISISTYGEHLNIPGYGKSDYSKYTKYCQVRFPFEVYDGEQYISSEQWIDFDTERLNAKSFYLPVGVDEGKYEIQFRTLAVNYDCRLDEEKLEKDANRSMENYGAADKITVQVVGRIYGMEITDIADYPRWTDVFYQSGGAVKTGKTYRIGKNNCNGEEIIGISEIDLFPVLSGSHPYNAFAGVVRLGYRVKFRCKTIGNMYGKDDRVVLKANYYYIDGQGKNRQQVDIYRKKDLEKIEQIISLTESNRCDQPVWNRNVKNPGRQGNSLQIWEGEYSLTPDIFLVPYGTDLRKYINGKGGTIRKEDSIFLKKGYLVVQFMIRTVSRGKPHLDYINVKNAVEGYCNMWKTEGFIYKRVDNRGVSWKFENGDMLLFDRYNTIYDDYQTVGTH